MAQPQQLYQWLETSHPQAGLAARSARRGFFPLPPAETSQKTPPAVDWKMSSPKSRRRPCPGRRALAVGKINYQIIDQQGASICGECKLPVPIPALKVAKRLTPSKQPARSSIAPTHFPLASCGLNPHPQGGVASGVLRQRGNEAWSYHNSAATFSNLEKMKKEGSGDLCEKGPI
ncbi:uncharacterized protein [Symphalangus syndactylus]|uniref:uncharacterized protein n=1 Tax=Symphalangus syndactylus TaxID=9590 RepID=UPI0024426F1F|nr:uncharacterized protein LOC129463023 [Symphalangus syndactylus]